MWISQISHLLLPTAGWSVTFSTYEAAAHPDILRTGSPTIVGIPAESGPAWHQVPGDQAVVHDPSIRQPRERDGYRLTDGSSAELPDGRTTFLFEEALAFLNSLPNSRDAPSR